MVAGIVSSVDYREIPSQEGYYAGSDGSIWSSWKRGRKPGRTNDWRKLKGKTHKSGHRYVVTKYTKPNSIAVHHLVLFAFRGPRLEGLECRHLNGVPNDNSPGNLEWGTRLENVRDAIQHGTFPRPRLISISGVRHMQSLRKQGNSITSIAFHFGVSAGYVAMSLHRLKRKE